MRWFNRRRIKCPDGSVVFVYRDPRDAIPIYVGGIQAEAKLSAKIRENIEAQVGGKYREQITGISRLVSEQTEKLLTRFLVIYGVYSDAPCAREQWLRERVDALLQETWRFDRARLQVEVVLALIKKGVYAEITTSLEKLIDDLSQPIAVQQLRDDVARAPELVARWSRI